MNKNNNNLILNSIDINFINSEFKNKYNYDIFISSDELNLEKTFNYFGNNIKNIYLSDVNYYLYDPKTNIVSYEDTFYKYISRNYDNHQIYPHSVMQFYRLYNCYNLMINHISITNYDYIIRSRLDISYEENIMNYLDILDSESDLQYFGYADCFSIGRVGIMEYYCKMIDNKYGLYINNNICDPIRWRYAPETQLSECLIDYCIINNLDPNISLKNMNNFCRIYRG